MLGRYRRNLSLLSARGMPCWLTGTFKVILLVIIIILINYGHVIL
jgi:hypothetical protein